MATNHKIRTAEAGAGPPRQEDSFSQRRRPNARQRSPVVILNEVKDLLFLPHRAVILSADFARRIPLSLLPRMKEGFFASLKNDAEGLSRRRAGTSGKGGAQNERRSAEDCSSHYIRPSKDQAVFAVVSPYASTIGATDSTLADERNAVQVIENNHRGYTPLDTLVSVESCAKSEEKIAAEGRFVGHAANLKTAGARIVSRGVR